MSGQAKRARWQAMVRWRDQAGRLLAPFAFADGIIVVPEGRTQGEHGLLGYDCYFDVHAARAHAKAMIAAAVEQDVFEDWCRDRGAGPETKASPAFAPPWLRGLGLAYQGGWPGVLAREFADEAVTCSCRSGVTWVTRKFGPHDVRVRARCSTCRETRARFTRAPVARKAARMWQRVLDMMDGRCPWNDEAMAQPDECGACERGLVGAGPWETVVGQDGRTALVATTTRECRLCDGTGLNRSGTIPPLKPPPSLRHRAI